MKLNNAALYLLLQASASQAKQPLSIRSSPFGVTRGGASETSTSASLEDPAVEQDGEEEEDFHARVHRAMEKLGLSTSAAVSSEDVECKDGVCTLPNTESNTMEVAEAEVEEEDDGLLEEKAQSIAQQADVSYNVAMIALIGNGNSVDRALEYLAYEKDLVSSISEDSAEVQELVNSDGYDMLEARRALALAGGDIENARAILVAEAADAEEEEAYRAQQEEAVRAHEATEQAMAARMAPKAKPATTVNIPSDFDPTKMVNVAPTTQSAAEAVDTVFDVTASNLFEKVVASPQPILLDVYATWCGPCKALTPVLEQVAGRAGGQLRLGKLDTDQERSISSTLGVQALPTVFGIYRGKILDSFQGMPTEEGLKSFIMNLVQNKANPSRKEELEELSSKLIKIASLSQFSFAARERLQTTVKKLLASISDDVGIEGALLQAQLLKKIFSNIVENLEVEKFQKINTVHPRMAILSSNALKLLLSAGFKKEGDIYTLKKGDNVSIANPAPLLIAIGVIDKFLDENRYLLTKIKRQQKDDALRKTLEIPDKNQEQESVSVKKVTVDKNISKLKIRFQGLKKIHSFEMNKSDKLSSVLGQLKEIANYDGELSDVQVTCASKRLVFSCTPENMEKELEELDLYPAVSIVIKFPSGGESMEQATNGSLADRAKAKKEKKKGSHTMQSVGIYSTNDNAKGELIDGGSGVLWEHDISDDDEEESNQETVNDDSDDNGNEVNASNKDNFDEFNDQ